MIQYHQVMDCGAQQTVTKKKDWMESVRSAGNQALAGEASLELMAQLESVCSESEHGC